MIEALDISEPFLFYCYHFATNLTHFSTIEHWCFMWTEICASRNWTQICFKKIFWTYLKIQFYIYWIQKVWNATLLCKAQVQFNNHYFIYA